MAQAYTSAKSPSYEEVLDLDRRLRRFMETAPFPHYAEQARQSGAFLAYVRANMIPRFAANCRSFLLLHLMILTDMHSSDGLRAPQLVRPGAE
jgi:hypothetical protein